MTENINAAFIKISKLLETPNLAIPDGILTEKERIENVPDLLMVRGYLP